MSFFVAVAIAVVSYSLGQGGPVAGLVFFSVLLLGVHIRSFGILLLWTCQTIYAIGRWFFSVKLEEVDACSLWGVTIVTILLLTFGAGLLVGDQLKENSKDSSYVCEELKSESFSGSEQPTASQTPGSSPETSLQDRVHNLCKEASDAKFYSDGAALGFYLIAVMTLVLAFAVMAAKGFSPAEYAATLIATLVLASQITFFGDTALWVVGLLILGLVAILVLRRLLTPP